MNVFQFFIICKRTNNANNDTHHVKLDKKRRESSKRNYYIISPRVIIKAIIIMKEMMVNTLTLDWPSCTTRGTAFNKEPTQDCRSLHQAAPTHSAKAPWCHQSFFLILLRNVSSLNLRSRT